LLLKEYIFHEPGSFTTIKLPLQPVPPDGIARFIVLFPARPNPYSVIIYFFSPALSPLPARLVIQAGVIS